MQNKVINTALSGKQAALVSGTNIKTINGTTLLGSGNVTTPDTTYSEITEAEITAGTASTATAISGRRMKFALDSRLNGYTIVKDGTDGAGIINFKTE